jgi:hypothetical protein
VRLFERVRGSSVNPIEVEITADKVSLSFSATVGIPKTRRWLNCHVEYDAFERRSVISARKPSMAFHRGLLRNERFS